MSFGWRVRGRELLGFKLYMVAYEPVHSHG